MVRPGVCSALLLATCCLLASCTERESSAVSAPPQIVQGARVNATRPLTTEEAHVVELARDAVAANDSWVEQAEFEIPLRKGSEWRVLVWRLHKSPGGHRLIAINSSGEVTQYLRGM